MIPAQFDYQAPATLDEALSLLAADPDGAKVLAGGHSLIPAMKLRLAQPQLLVDIARIKSLSYIREEDNHILIGATPAIVGAIVDALAPFGIKHIDMPVTAEKTFRILYQANANQWTSNTNYAEGDPKS